MIDPYQALGVAKGASDKEIKSAYRKLAKELHPDKNKDNPKATERFSDVTRAYDLLLDKDKRAQFDRGEIDGEGNPTAPFGFGGGGGYQRSAPPPKGANVAYRLKVEFTAAATLQKQRITLEDGKTIDLSLPKGVEEGTQMRLSGKGRPGPGGNGDAIVTIHINPHPFYERDGDNIKLDLPVSLKEAVEGAKIKVPTVDGPVMLSIPAGSSSGKTLRLKNKGFHGKSGVRGNQLVTLMIVVPEKDEKLAEFVKDWNPKDNPRASMGV